VLLIGGDPSNEHPMLAWALRTDARLSKARIYIAHDRNIKLERQAKATLTLPGGGYNTLSAILEKGESDFAKAVLAEESLVVIFGEEFRGADVESLVAWGLKRGNVRFAYLGDHSNSRGAADMGLFPDLLPGYVPVTSPGEFDEYTGLARTAGMSLPEMAEAAKYGKLAGLIVVGANPIAKSRIDPGILKNTFIVAQELFLTETAALADVVFPAASLYEKSGTVTNTFGDVQMVRKGADLPGVKPDFEILVRLAAEMGAPVKSLVHFGKSAVSADLGQSRGAQSGEADREAVWLAGRGLEPRLSPFDPFAAFDEITRLVPGYALDRLNLLSGNDVRTEIGASPKSTPSARGHIDPAHDGLFTSGTLGRYSKALKGIQEHQEQEELAESAAD
jgi:Molybdopterin oxidoreductase